MINPYCNISWSSVLCVPSCSHEHCTGQVDFNTLVREGLRHLALSNYHPPKIWYPLSEHFDVPDGVIGSPNAEFYNMDIGSLHINGLGSMYSLDGEPLRSSWKYTIGKILQNLQYRDGGGATLNHPAWTKASGNQLKNQDLCDMLDFDSRVLGIEIYNATGGDLIEGCYWDLDTWDYILKTGRRCWGFCVPDHDGQNRTEGFHFRGRNFLLCSEFTEHECLKAYREGRFYGGIYDTTLKFTSINLSGNTLLVSATDAEYINFVVDGVYNRVNGTSATFNIPSNATYVRVEAHNEENSIYSQPIIFKLRKNVSINTAKNMLILG